MEMVQSMLYVFLFCFFFFFAFFAGCAHSGMVWKLFTLRKLTDKVVLWPLKLMTSQVVEGTWIRTGGYGRLRGEWVKECLLYILKSLILFSEITKSQLTQRFSWTSSVGAHSPLVCLSRAPRSFLQPLLPHHFSNGLSLDRLSAYI